MNIIFSTTKVWVDEGEDSPITCFTITFDYLPGFKIVISLHEPEICSKEDYAKLAAGGNVSLEFCDSNGGVSIDCCNKIVKFTVSKFGAGGDGEIEVEIPYESCKDALVEFYMWRNNINEKEEVYKNELDSDQDSESE